MAVSVYTKLDDFKISHLPTDRVYSTYVHYEKSKGKPTYHGAINPFLYSTQLSVHSYVITIPHQCGGLLGWEIEGKRGI